MKATRWIFWLTLLAVVVTVNGLAYQRERLMAEGQRVYLALAPVDMRRPRRAGGAGAAGAAR